MKTGYSINSSQNKSGAKKGTSFAELSKSGISTNKIIRNLSKAALANNNTVNSSINLTTMETMKTMTSSKKKTTATDYIAA